MLSPPAATRGGGSRAGFGGCALGLRGCEGSGPIVRSQERAALDKEIEELNQRLLTKRPGPSKADLDWTLEFDSSQPVFNPQGLQNHEGAEVLWWCTRGLSLRESASDILEKMQQEQTRRLCQKEPLVSHKHDMAEEDGRVPNARHREHGEAVCRYPGSPHEGTGCGRKRACDDLAVAPAIADALWSGGVAAADSRPEEGACRACLNPALARVPLPAAAGLKEVIEAKAKEGVLLLEQQHSESREASGFAEAPRRERANASDREREREAFWLC